MRKLTLLFVAICLGPCARLQAAAPAGSSTVPPQLTPLLAPSPSGASRSPPKKVWAKKRQELKQQWLEILGPFPKTKPPLMTAILGAEEFPEFTRQHLQYQVLPGVFTDGYLLTPKGPEGKLPAVVVFHPTTPFGARGVAGLEPSYPHEKWQGIHLVRQGYLVWCPRNFINTEGTNYAGNAAHHLATYPGWTGMGRMTWDAIRAADFLESWPRTDRKRISCLGHSLGAKEVLYAMAFDERYHAGVFSEGGIGLTFSNWDAPWYLGKQIKAPGFARDHHELIALIAPRPFLLIAGDSADHDRSLAFIEAARPIYALLGAGSYLKFWNHRQGHVYSPAVHGKATGFLSLNVR
jgi:dienelactone hydrolase